MLPVRHDLGSYDSQADPLQLMELAEFMGLNCTLTEVEDIRQRHTYSHIPDKYNTYGLSVETLEWMNGTMSKLLPEKVLTQYDLFK